MLKIILILYFSLALIPSHGFETCSRTATINFQEVLVDANSSEKGEGLRYHLEKDPEAKKFLDIYQNNSGIRLPNAILGTLGTGLIISGLFTSNSQNARDYLITGSATLLVNYLVAKTLEITNEENLNKAIDEYNKRNLPKIYFNPENTRETRISLPNLKLGLSYDWRF